MHKGQQYRHFALQNADIVALYACCTVLLCNLDQVTDPVADDGQAVIGFKPGIDH